MRVLSLCDGISCGMVAFERAGISVEEYNAYEIDKYAMQVSQKNYPQIMQHGDVTKANFKKHQDADIVIAGTPCQGFNVNDVDKSALVLMFSCARSEDDVDLAVYLAEYAIKKEYGKRNE